MQYKVICLHGEVGSSVILSISNISKAGGWVFVCYLVSFLFRTMYVRYLMAFWCICFTRSLMLDLGIFSWVSFSMECS